MQGSLLCLLASTRSRSFVVRRIPNCSKEFSRGMLRGESLGWRVTGNPVFLLSNLGLISWRKSMEQPLRTVFLVLLAFQTASALAQSIYVSDYGANAIYKFDSSGHRILFASGPLLNGPGGLALDVSGNVYVCN